MQTCVVAYPELAPADHAWIELLRERHDPNYRLVAPHWTLIFPTAAIDPAAIERHVAQVAARFSPFAFELRCALVVRDAFSPLTHLFLVPDAGFGQLVRLHDALYGGMLADQLRLDVPYIPHITIGAFDDAHACKAVADTLNQGGLAISGLVGRLSILAVEPGRVTLAGTIPLGSTSDHPGDSEEQGRGIEGEFILSWESTERYYQQVRSHVGLDPAVFDFIAAMRDAGYDTSLRAGHSMWTLVLSRSRRHRMRHPQPHLRFDFNEAVMTISGRITDDIRLTGVPVALTPSIIDLLNQLAAERIY
jgi:hypothetical protein